ncbi:MAG: HAD-IC family P-type ATPase [Burkholderiales bacterium]|nr:HAD-IC family P-type ATPase [Burkholderiales bacterium]
MVSVTAAIDPSASGVDRDGIGASAPRDAATPLVPTHLQVAGLQCAACALRIEAALRAVPGVRDASVNAVTCRAQVASPDPIDAAALVAAVRAAGYDAVPDGPDAGRALRRREARTALWQLFVAAFCAMQVMMFAAPTWFTAPGEIAPDLRRLLHWGSAVLAVPVVLLAAGPFFRGAWRGLRDRRLTADLPVAIGLVTGFVASAGAAFDPGGVFGHDVWFDSLTMFVALLLGSRWLAMRARHRAAEALDGALDTLPSEVVRIGADGRDETVALAAARVGDRLRVAHGDAFGVDAVVVVGDTHVDEASLTGESAVAALLRDAASTRSDAAAASERWVAPFLAAVLATAIGAALLWAWLDASRIVPVVVAVLVVTCPCALAIAVPSVQIAAAGALARRGVLLRRLDALDALARIDRLAIDKTGTLTDGLHAGVAGVASRAGTRVVPIDVGAWTARAAALAAWSSHPAAAAVRALAPQASAPWTDVRETVGAGVSGRDADGREWRLGRAAWVRGDRAVDGRADAGPDADDALRFGPADGPWLRFTLAERIRPDARDAIGALCAAGVAVTLLSGDTAARVAPVAAATGIDTVVAAATPQGKLDTVRAAQARGERVAMLGDGVNDAPVLACADVSFAMGDGALLARAHADAIVVSQRLGDVVAAHAVARRARRRVRQNLGWAVAYNAVAVPLAVAGVLAPWLAGLGMAVSSLLVAGNAARLARD